MREQFGHYRLGVRLGSGHFAKVYKAFDEQNQQDVALKLLKPFWSDDSTALTRFVREAKVMAQLDHPNIVTLYDWGEEAGQVYLVQQLIEGESLAARLKRSPLSWQTTLAMLKPITSALDYAHQIVIHRDIKPANILLDHHQQIYLSDFGMVKAVEGSTNITATTGGMIGTAPYTAPEQWYGRLNITPQTDLYALSCTVFEMLTGQVLFNGPNAPAVMNQHINVGPQFPTHWPKGVPSGVADVLQIGLAKEPTARFANAKQLLTQLIALNKAKP